MKQFEKILFYTLIGVAPPLFLGVSGVVIWFYLSGNEVFAPYYAIAGIVIGTIIDLVYLKKWIGNLFVLPLSFLVFLYISYSLMIYGMFMGFPGFNLILAPLAGYYFGQKYKDQELDEHSKKKMMRHIPLFTAAVMLIFCIITVLLILSETSIGSEFQAMLKLKEEVPYTLVAVITVTGSIILVLLQYFLTRLTLQKLLNN